MVHQPNYTLQEKDEGIWEHVIKIFSSIQSRAQARRAYTGTEFEHLWIALVIGIVLLVAWYGMAPFSFFKNLGIPGPTPWPFLGNLPQIMSKPHQMFLFDEEVAEKYGRVAGVYLGRKPTYVISDVDLIKQITVKEFSKFPNRPLSSIGSQSIFDNKSLLTLEDEEWRRIRVTITPTFSALKLKQITPLVHQSAKTLGKKLEQIAKTGEIVDMWRYMYVQHSVVDKLK